MRFFLPILLFFSLCISANGTEKFARMNSMNGYKLADYEGFEKKWHLVTVRFRKDSEEMRFTYANELAWNALLTKKPFPDGAVFAKIGLATKEDPLFESSAVPKGARRYQLMVRNHSKHKATDGWGYALFDDKGLTFPEDPKAQEIACAACHRLARDRDFVFSEQMDLAPIAGQAHEKIATSFAQLKFSPAFSNQLSAAMRKIVGYKKVFLLQGELQNSLFQGTLDEVRPLLTREAIKQSAPAALLSKDKKRFSLVMRDLDSHLCDNENKIAMRSFLTTIDTPDGLQEMTFCHAK